MATWSAGVKTGAGSTILPLFSVFSSAVADLWLKEIGIFNTTTTAFDVKLVRITGGPGTVGAGLTELCLDNPSMVTAQGQAFTTHTAGTPAISDGGYRASIGAAIGAGMVWTFGGNGIEIPAVAGTVQGWGAVAENGAGQASQCYVVWQE